MSALVFLDTETTSLRYDRRAWEVALILRMVDGGEMQRSWFIEMEDLDLGNADLKSLEIGKFHDRHPQASGRMGGQPQPELRVLLEIEALTRGATIVGAVPNFDTEVLGARMRANGICPSWHYHLQDVETIAAGCLRGRGEQVDYPYKSDDLSRRLGVEPPSDEDRHTALGDAKWAMRLWDAVMA